MNSKRIFSIAVLVATLLLTGCGGGRSEDEEEFVPVQPELPAPGNVVLSAPADNTACLKSSSTNTAQVVFSWNTSANANSYRIEIKNLNTQSTTGYNVNGTMYTAILEVNTPYSWSVQAINQTGSKVSPVWKFYLSGIPESNYAPFPADLTSPAPGATFNANGASTVQVTFQWIGSDPDNDVKSYAVYTDNSNASTQVVASQTATSLTRSLASGKTYYWKVVTTDKAGNTSTSVVNSFQVK
ncbi:hypothetical protein IR083_19860 [Dysgonomonas sp. GY75]|uniref:hypothetical protein n=1 Tax=Dysgonomonas sp. GY75 TaxID=2780419 RepID=UPI0018831D87|nr:hypothetical protein [Dysgonomonas sp. GY75]MBF0651076.1 hypothetical protein [Dysgonomonas sp. GY75]